MSALSSILLIVHVLSIIALMALLLLQFKKNPRKLHPAAISSVKGSISKTFGSP